MEYGLRRYEATQRLLWFVFFLLCLGLPYLVGRPYDMSQSPGLNPSLETLKSFSFWTGLHWVKVEPLGKFMVYFIRVAVLFLFGRLLWLVIQWLGKILIQNLLAEHITHPAVRTNPVLDPGAANLQRLFPSEILLRKVDSLFLQLLFHPYQRLRLMLGNPQGSCSSEELMEKERRIVETDWQIIWSSWSPFRWIIWLLPLLGLIQAAWLFYTSLQPALQGHKDLQEVLGNVVSSLLPLLQIIVVAVVFGLTSGLMRRLENLYLSGVDAMFYDQFLSRLPFQSSDTVILLQAMQRHFQELYRILKRLERSQTVQQVSEKEIQGGSAKE